ncbi:iron-containing alcohol dehydrogenase family protein [Paenibacillus piri]|uniref:Iron-containing alcohol dehydrogenase n=1 Tax=Paenibacillus piri TaxID=2547395 RepID=A0A4R5KBR9_9BACL|nr:iron-containing alcohol dehydrogenase [Paenibacillus piri]TDF92526.1 iron-containing alcohol dehydrogenase [Paenibacillus piri]
MRNTWEYFPSGTIMFGNGAIQKLGQVVSRMNAHRVLLITDKGIARSGILQTVTGLLEQSGRHVQVFDGTIPEPPVSLVQECYEAARAGESPDVIIGLGGGSSIDMAKIVALLMKHGGKPQDYFGEHSIPGPILPLIAIPTTAGTGSEVTSVAVVNDTEHSIKVGISNNYLRPQVALLDPELTIELPPYVTACSGIDALAHAVEAYLAKDYAYIQAEGELLFQGAAPISDTLALEAIERISGSLIAAVQQGSNMEARSHMLLGSLMAGLAFSNAGTAAAHALAYPIGGLTKSPHGEVTGLLLPYVIEYNAMAAGAAKMHKFAQALGLHTSALNAAETAQEAVACIFRLLEQIGLPSRLSDIGVAREQLPEIAAKAVGIDRLIRNNPRTPTVDGFLRLLERAY